MPLITYIDHKGNAFEADVPVGDSVMQGAVDNMIDGIIGQCGGACACATCHCIVEDAWFEKTGPASDEEKLMLEMSSEMQDNSRLSCQIEVTDDLDGLVVHMPQSQY